MIRAALGRISQGEYGYCMNCGEEIAERRLELVPNAAHCRACAATKNARERLPGATR